MLGYSQHPKEHTEAHSSLPRRMFFHDRPQVWLGKALFLPLAGEDPMEASVLLKVLYRPGWMAMTVTFTEDMPAFKERLSEGPGPEQFLGLVERPFSS